MSDVDDAASILEGFTPISPKHPSARSLADSVAQLVETREALLADANTTALAECMTADVANVTRPGDVLVLRHDDTLTQEYAETIRLGMLARMPGLADVVFIPCELVTIYRGNPTT